MAGEPKCESQDAISSQCISRFKGKFALTEYGGVSAGKRQTCAIKCVNDQAADYTDPWAVNNNQQWPEYPPATCAQGKVVCWGDDRLGQGAGGLAKLQLGEIDDFISVCAGASHSCAVRKEGSIYCWGHDGNLRTRVPQRLINRQWRGVRCRGAHTCAITMINQINRSSLECWGHNGHKQGNVPQFANQILVPVPGSTVPKIRKEIYSRAILNFDSGDYHTCAVWGTTSEERDCNLLELTPPAMNGECWGGNDYGQTNLNLNFRPFGWQVTDICAVMYYRQISTGSYHSCGITTDDPGLFCAKESQCDEYPKDGSELNVCPRHIAGAQVETPRQAYKNKDEVEFDPSSEICVPTRTNHLRYLRVLPQSLSTSRGFLCYVISRIIWIPLDPSSFQASIHDLC